MSVLKILIVLLLIIFFVGRVRLGGGVEYDKGGMKVDLRLGASCIRVLPRKKTVHKKIRKQKTQREEAPTEKEKSEHRSGGAIERILEFLPVVCEAAGELSHSIRIDELLLDYTAGGRDAAGVTMAFGGSNAAIGMLLPLFEQNFDLRDYRLRTTMDFSAKGPVIYLCVKFSARLGQLVSFAIRFGWKFLMIFWKQKI